MSNFKPVDSDGFQTGAESGALLAAALCLHGNLTLQAGPESSPFRGRTEVPELVLGSVTGGRDAIRALGAHLPEVAGRHGMSASQMALRLSGDPALRVDRTGRLVYGCPGTMAAATVTLGGATSGVAPAPLADTFRLHSRPGATLVIYLDFDGNTTTGTPWNSNFTAGAPIVTPPFDIDGNPAAFADTELQRIQLIWQRVAEDYAAFNVDVTTEDPGVEGLRKTSPTDTAYGVRVCIGGTSYDWYGAGAGGVSYVGCFDWSSDTPNFVFPAQLGNGNEKYTAEAISHEVGHALSLVHDGQSPSTAYYSGQGTSPMTWAPIMGVGYYANITQFSKGEYSNANNTQDDLALIASYVGYRADDHGDTMATATYVPVGTQFSVSGIISGQNDVDVIAFATGAGSIALNLTSGTEDANLDLAAELRDSNGTLVATSNPATSLGASFNLSVPAGTYFVFVRGAGYLDPLTTGYSAYGSIGSFQITGLVPSPTGNVAPVAAPAASPASGIAPLTATFDGSASFDPDGAVASYAWSFSDGTTASGVSVTRVITTAGTYTGTLTVTDNGGLAATASVAVSVSAANVPPSAAFNASPSSGTGPLAVAFDAAGSSDPDGSIVSYAWTFGDGTTGTGVAPSHTYTSVGVFTATLIVTDNSGATATASLPISVLQDPAKVIRVQSLALAVVSGRGRATVKVTNLSGSPVSGVAVSGKWGGILSANGSGTTDSTGTATIASSPLNNKKGTLTFTVTGLGKSGLTYDPTKNLVGSVSIQAAATVGGK